MVRSPLPSLSPECLPLSRWLSLNINTISHTLWSRRTGQRSKVPSPYFHLLLAGPFARFASPELGTKIIPINLKRAITLNSLCSINWNIENFHAFSSDQLLCMNWNSLIGTKLYKTALVWSCTFLEYEKYSKKNKSLFKIYCCTVSFILRFLSNYEKSL